MAPDSLVNGSVDAISGTYYESHEDVNIPGIEPLNFKMNYHYGITRLSQLYDETFGAGHCLSHPYLSLYQHDHMLTEGSGGHFYCSELSKEQKGKFTYTHKKIRSYFELGLSNTSKGYISGQNNLKNARLLIKQESKKPHKEQTLTVTLGDGSQRFYTCKKIEKKQGKGWCGIFLLEEEVKASGNRILYEYDTSKQAPQPTCIKATNADKSIIFSWIKFTYEGNLLKYLTTSCGNKVNYNIQTQTILDFNFLLHVSEFPTKVAILNKVTSTSYPSRSYEYTFKQLQEASLKSKDAQGNFLKTTFYHFGNQEVLGEKIPVIIDQKGPDKRYKRVKYQDAPTGPKGSSIKTHTFLYDKESFRGKDRATWVFNHEGNKTAYCYNEEKRLTAIEFYHKEKNKKEQTLYRVVRFYWGKKGSQEEGDLVSKTVEDAKGKTLSCRHLKYDKRGNVIEEHLLGNLSGKSKVSIKIQGNGVPVLIKGECYTIYKKYSKKASNNIHYNLLLEEKDSFGKKIQYAYKDNSNLLTKKLTFLENQIVQREFFSYDKNASCILHVCDDGNCSDPKNLRGVRERKILEIIPRKQTPAYGLPEIVMEKYWDPSSQQEKLLKKVVKTYNKKGLVEEEKIYNAREKFCYSLKTTYNAYNKPLKITDAEGNVTHYKYDANGNKTQEMSPKGDHQITHLYGPGNRLVEKKVQHLSQKSTDSTRFEYDPAGRKIKEIDPYKNETDFTYDAFGRPTKILYPTTEVNGKMMRPQKTRGYNIFDQVIEETDSKGKKTKHTYNLRGQKTQTIYPDGSQKNWIYHLDGTLHKEIDRQGLAKVHTYDALKRCIKTEFYQGTRLLKTLQWSYQGKRLVKKTDAEGYHTHFIYDGAGRKITKIFPDGNKTHYHYDDLGRISQEETPFNSQKKGVRLVSKTYDFLHRITQEKIHSPSEKILQKILYKYDAVGNQIAITRFSNEHKAHTTSYLYNAYNELEKETNPLGETTTYSYSKEKHPKLKGQFLRKLQKKDPSGNETITIFNASMRPFCIVKKSLQKQTLSSCLLSYNERGEKLGENHTVYAEHKKKQNYALLWAYNAMGELISRIENPGHMHEKKISYSYDSSGRLWKIIKADGKVLEHHYDALGRLKELSCTKDFRSIYTYDKNDRLINVEDIQNNQSFNTTLDYDARGNLVSETLGNGHTLSYTYDALKRLLSFRLFDGSHVNYFYDACHLKEITRYDENKRLLYTHHYQDHDLSGNCLLESHALDAKKSTYQFDALGRKVQSTHPYFSQTIPQNGYDHSGNLTCYKLKDPIGEMEYYFTYNERQQLLEEKLNTHTLHSFSYDSLDNRLQKDTHSYCVNDFNQVKKDGVYNYTYDTNGNLVKKTDGNESILFTYDPLDRLICVEKPQKLRITYTYDAFNRRLNKRFFQWEKESWQEAKNLEKRFIYNGQNEIGSSDVSSTIQEMRILSPDKKAEIAAAVTFELYGHTYVPLYDHRGNVCCLIHAHSGKVIQTYRYSAFGPYPQEETFHCPWRFSSKRSDPETGLIYFGRRYYNPELGRWITKDPQGPRDGPNLYAYVHNRPLTLLDLYGLFTTDPVLSTHYEKIAEQYITDLSPKDSKMVVDLASRNIDKWHFKVEGSTISHGRISFGNGIFNHMSEAADTAQSLSELSGGYQIEGIYNNSRSLAASRALMESAGYKTKEIMNLETLFCRSYLDFAFLRFLGEKTAHLHLSHSHGGIQAKHTLSRLPEQVRQHTQILNINGANIVPENYAGNVLNIQSKRDFVPFFDILGQLKHGDKILRLNPHPNAPLLDHSISSPTFKDILEDKINAFIKDYHVATRN